MSECMQGAYNYALVGLGRPGAQLGNSADHSLGLMNHSNGAQPGQDYGAYSSQLNSAVLGDPGLLGKMEQLNLGSMPLQCALTSQCLAAG